MALAATRRTLFLPLLLGLASSAAGHEKKALKAEEKVERLEDKVERFEDLAEKHMDRFEKMEDKAETEEARVQKEEALAEREMKKAELLEKKGKDKAASKLLKKSKKEEDLAKSDEAMAKREEVASQHQEAAAARDELSAVHEETLTEKAEKKVEHMGHVGKFLKKVEKKEDKLEGQEETVEDAEYMAEEEEEAEDKAEQEEDKALKTEHKAEQEEQEALSEEEAGKKKKSKTEEKKAEREEKAAEVEERKSSRTEKKAVKEESDVEKTEKEAEAIEKKAENEEKTLEDSGKMAEERTLLTKNPYDCKFLDTMVNTDGSSAGGMLSTDELDAMVKSMQCDKIQNIGGCAEKLAKELPGGFKAMLDKLKADVGGATWEKILDAYKKYEDYAKLAKDTKKNNPYDCKFLDTMVNADGGSAGGMLSTDELDAMVKSMKCDKIQNIGGCAEKLAKDLPGGFEAMLDKLKTNVGEATWEKILDAYHHYEEQQKWQLGSFSHPAATSAKLFPILGGLALVASTAITSAVVVSRMMSQRGERYTDGYSDEEHLLGGLE